MVASPELTDPDLGEQTRRWIAAGLITPEQGAAIARFEETQPAIANPARPRINLGAVLMYLGGFLVLLAVTVFLAFSWHSYTTAGQFLRAALVIGGLGGIGFALRRRYPLPLPGNLLIFAATGAVPLLVYTFERLTGFLPGDLKMMDTTEYHARVQAAWVVMGLVTLVTAATVTWLIRFPPTLLLAGFWGWVLAVDLTRWVGADSKWAWNDAELWVGAAWGALLVAVGMLLHRRRMPAYSLWLFLVGHAALLLNLTILGIDKDNTALNLFFLLLYLSIVVASVWLQSSTFLAFGAAGTYGLVCYIVLRNLHGVGGVTLGLVFIGLFVVFSGMAYQKWLEPRLLRLFGHMKRPGRRPILS